MRFARRGSQLLVFLRADPGSLASAALNAALVRATSTRVPGAELDSTRWTAAELARWERQPVATSTAPADGSDARWVWILCLVLIGLETWMRSRQRAVAGVIGIMPHEERAA
jgi:hypothetical protein